MLALLLTTLVAVSVTSYLGYTPWYTTAIPASWCVAFLVVARLTVRAQQVRRVAPVQQSSRQRRTTPVETPAAVEARWPMDTEPDLGAEDTQGLSRDELAEAVAAPVLDEGGLWDPLPVTLPTYVNKPRARRTVRTIEITAGSTGITSSGHDAADSALAAEAAAAEQEAVADEAVRAPQGRRRLIAGPDSDSVRVAVVTFPLHSGAVAQLVARLVRNEKVRGSNPLSSTKPAGQAVTPGSSTRRLSEKSAQTRHFSAQRPGGSARLGRSRRLSAWPAHLRVMETTNARPVRPRSRPVDLGAGR